MQLDLALRMRVHTLMDAVAEADPAGVTDLTPGIRSLQIQADPSRLSQHELLAAVRQLVAALPPTDQLVVPSRRPPPPVLGRPGHP
ncbi:carboxyltransferase domain-containing protein [Streptomyces sp. F001]|uniref:carboxyltransferase domain-containing protein n=1 Tax=Streptomyces sp. F001 TaxID=1510026 RepID=UPI001F0F3707|nr:carboxyltransferase domain-containing protein [Streptomyces sp. F001]